MGDANRPVVGPIEADYRWLGLEETAAAECKVVGIDFATLFKLIDSEFAVARSG